MKLKKLFAGIAMVAVVATCCISLLSACADKKPVEYTVTFNYNYEGAPAAATKKVEEGKTVEKPADPTRSLYIFDSWYTEAACTTKYDFTSAVNGNLNLYAGWTADDKFAGKTEYVFEAECVDLSDFNGAGYSGGATMVGAILTDWDGTAGASGGLFMSFMYVKGDDTKLTFNINSDKDVNDAILVLRLSGEVIDPVEFDWTEWKVMVNGEAINYGDISINGCRTDMSQDWVRPFEDFTITTTLSLKAGANVIELITDNDKAMAGTMFSTAPMVDCMKIYTDAVLTWEPIENKEPYTPSK